MEYDLCKDPGFYAEGWSPSYDGGIYAYLA